MIPADEAGAVLEWAWQAITTDPDVLAGLASLATRVGQPMGAEETLATRVWSERVPHREAPTPAILLSATDAVDTPRLGAQERFMVAVPVSVKVIVPGESTQGVGAVLAPIYALLQGNHNAEHVTPEGVAIILTGERRGTFRYPETVDGLEYRHVGADFTVTIQ